MGNSCFVRILECCAQLGRFILKAINYQLLNFEKSTIIQECLNAVVNGPFIDDSEFPTIFGLSRDEVNEVLAQWPNINIQDETVQLAINNSFANLLGYPIDHQERWSEYVSVDQEQLGKIFREWRVEVYGKA